MSFTAGAIATSPQLVSFAPRLLHNIAGLVGPYDRRAAALGWENCGRLMSSRATRAVVTTGGERKILCFGV
jgi:hypothetical protein